MSANTVWESKSHWLCLNHTPAVRLPSAATSCWMAGCECKRPIEPDVFPVRKRAQPPAPKRIFPKARPATTAKKEAAPTRERKGLIALDDLPPFIVEQLAKEASGTAPNSMGERCALEGCDETARPGSKYCSRTCSNRNARRRYKKKARAEKRAA
jgi:hypothetical protein